MAEVTALLSEARWLEGLARSLASDGAEAADAVQETWLAAMRSPPDPDRPVRPWLRRVLVNALRMRHRTRKRRESYEQQTDILVEHVRTPEQLLERALLERKLADLVLALEEPYRSTVLLRYRDNLSAEAIALQQHVPAGTVRRRLKTALDRMRHELDGDTRGRRHAVLAPLLGVKGVMGQTASKGGLAIILAIVALLGVVGGVVVWRGRSASSDHATSTETTARAGAVAPHVATQSSTAIRELAQPGVAERELAGRVTEGGRPFAGAIVRLAHADTQTVVGEVTSDANGRFTFGAQPATAYVVVASAPNKAPGIERVDLRAPPRDVELVLSPCSRLVGTVLDGAGTPIAGARISNADAPWPFAEADATGAYSLCMPFGTARVLFSASGYGGVWVIVAIDVETRFDVRLLAEATIAGRVVDEYDRPVADAWISIDPFDKGTVREAAVTGRSDADGTFRIVQVAPGRNRISAFAGGRMTSRRHEIVAGPGQTIEDVVLRLVPAGGVRGVVVADGAPVAGVGVGIRIGNRDERGIIAITQADGTFALDRIPRTEIGIYVENHTVLAPRSVIVGESTETLRIEVARLGEVRGRVLRKGVPVASARVQCEESPDQFSDSAGRFTCKGLSQGLRHFVASSPDGSWGEVKVTVSRGSTHDADIELGYNAQICGTVVDIEGAPLFRIEVIADSSDDEGMAMTTADGKFCVRFLAGKRTYTLTANGRGQPLVPAKPFAPVPVPEVDTRVEVTLVVTRPNRTIAGIVKDPQGNPVADVRVRAMQSRSIGERMFSDRASTYGITDASGGFSIDRLPDGVYAMVASGREGNETVLEHVPAGKRDVAIVLEAAGRIEGTLVGFQSEPVITGVIANSSRNPIDAEVEGTRFFASGLPPGTYTLMAFTGAREGDTQRVIVKANETTHVTMTSRGSASVSGIVRDWRTRKPLEGMRCIAAPRNGAISGVVYNGPDSDVRSDANGAFTIPEAPAGDILVECRGPSSGIRLATATRDRPLTVEVLATPDIQQGDIGARFDFIAANVIELERGGPADNAGLALGDEITAINDIATAGLAGPAAMRAINNHAKGSRVTLRVRRGSTDRVVEVTIR